MARSRLNAVVAAVVMAICSSVATAGAASASERPVALFDEGHGEHFLPEHDGPLDLSRFATVLRQQGFEVRATDQALSDESLAHVDVLVIAGAFKTLTSAEVDATTRFVDRGGRLLVTLHIGPPVANLLHRLNTSISNGVICESENVIDDICTNFRVTRFESHPLTKGVNEFRVFGGWALLSTGANASAVASTGPRAWIDLNGDGKLGGRDAVQSFAVLVAGQYGRGRFAVFGDDAVFQNQFLEQGNLALATNLAAWLAERPI